MTDKDRYDFSRPRRGLAVIISIEKFSDPNLRRRACAPKDALKAEKTFHKIGFEVQKWPDLTASEIEDKLQRAAKEFNHCDSDCFVCVLMSHGGQKMLSSNPNLGYDYICGSDAKKKSDEEGHIKVETILNIFSDENCPGLKDKPRLFFIQACRGPEIDTGVQVRAQAANPNPSQDANPIPSQDANPTLSQDANPIPSQDANPIPSQDVVDKMGRALQLDPHFLLASASPPGYKAFKSSMGSWFIISLCETLDRMDLASNTLQRVLTAVCRDVATNYEGPDIKEVPTVNDQLMYDLFLMRENEKDCQ